jgi:hypothetical protein
MGVQIREPDVDHVSLEDWQKFLLRTTAQGGGYMFIDFENMDTAGQPLVSQGSHLELNGAFFELETYEKISGTPIDGLNFIYAVPSGDTVTFVCKANEPTFSPQKGGWFNGNERAVMKFTYIGKSANTGVLYRNKVILNTQMAMYEDNLNTLEGYK